MNDGAPPRPDPKPIRPSIVDSGWSVPPPAASEPPPALPPPPTRPLPNYEAQETAGVREVTLVDREVQSRARAMREKDTLPPPRRASSFPQVPPPPSRPQAAPPPSVRPLAPSVRPPPPSVRPAPPPPPGAERSVLAPAAAPARPSAPAPAAGPSPADAVSVAAARSAATLVRPRPSLSPQALPSFAGALAQRVRFAGGEVPLWSLVTPLVLLVALGAAFAAAAVTSPADPGAALKVGAEPSASAAVAVAAPTPLPPAPVVSANSDEKPKPLTLLERVSLGEDSAVKELSAKPVADLRVEEAISLSLGQSAQDLRAARALRDRVEHDPGLIKDPEVLAQLRKNIDDPGTAREALAAIANVPGPISADMIYEVWTATAARSAATDLARALIYSKEVRAKASKALAIALDLRDADTCEKSRDLLERASSDGDRRSFHLLNKLTRKYGCGPNKRQDCYACLRDGKDLEATLKIVKARREPRPFGG